MHILSTFAENTYIKIVAGLILILSSGVDLWDELEGGVQAEHGIIIFALWHILRALPELQHATSEIASTRKK